MLTLEIDGHSFVAPEKFSELTHRRFIELNEFHDRTFPESLQDKELADYTDEDNLTLVKYAKDVVIEFFGIDEHLANELRVNGDNSIMGAYWMIHKFLSMPEESEIEISHKFKFKNKNYYCAKDSIDHIAGNPNPDATWLEFEEASTIQTNMKALMDNKLNPLAMLTAVLYRPLNEKYDSDKVKKRAELFQDLTMDKIFGAVFFLMQHKLTLLKNIKPYLKEEAEAVQSLLSSDGSQ